MKRFIFVPYELYLENKGIPHQAELLSQKSFLPLRIGEQGELTEIKDVEIISFPEQKFITYEKSINKNFLQCIDYINDYVSLNKNFYCKVIGSNKQYIFYPKIAEKHCLKFKFRIEESGSYIFNIVNSDESIIFDEGEFNII